MDGILILVTISPLFIFLVLMIIYSTRIRKVGPNQALIVYGRVDPRDSMSVESRITTRVVIGGRTFIWPFLEKAEYLSLEPAVSDLMLDKVVTSTGERVTLRGRFQYKVSHDHLAAMKAAMHFLSKTELERTKVVAEVVESILRRVVEESTREQIEQSPIKFGDRVVEAGRPKMEEMGIEIITLIIDEVR